MRTKRHLICPRRKFQESVNAGNEVHPSKDDVSNVWSFEKDGKQYWPTATKKDMGK